MLFIISNVQNLIHSYRLFTSSSPVTLFLATKHLAPSLTCQCQPERWEAQLQLNSNPRTPTHVMKGSTARGPTPGSTIVAPWPNWQPPSKSQSFLPRFARGAWAILRLLLEIKAKRNQHWESACNRLLSALDTFWGCLNCLCPIPQLLSTHMSHVRAKVTSEPGFVTLALLSQDGRNPIKQPWYFFYVKFIVSTLKDFLRGSIFFNHMMILYSCPE